MSNELLKFKDVKEVEEYAKQTTKEELVFINDINNIQNKDFSNERKLVEYFVDNIDLFAKDILNDKVVSFEVEKPITKQRSLSSRGRIDLYIVGEKSNYIIEFKNPNSTTELKCAIGQLLDYGREITDPKKELILISTKYDHNTQETIKYYNLPIRFIYVSKKIYLEAKKWEQEGL